LTVLAKALKILEKYSVCDTCLGRQFALLGHGMENEERGKRIKRSLTLKTYLPIFSKENKRTKKLRPLATNGLFKRAEDVLLKKKDNQQKIGKTCFLCEGKIKNINNLAKKALKKLRKCEFNNFLVGTELPIAVEEREEEFKAKFKIQYGEHIRNDFGRLIGKKIAKDLKKVVEHKNPEVVVLVNPFSEEITLQKNPLYVAGRYRKLVRDIPQSIWLCPSCRGSGCEKCNSTGKKYSESIEEIVGKPFLDATRGVKTAFHSSGREDIDVRMLGNGRPFVIEIVQPKKRFLDLTKLKESVNNYGKGKVEISKLQFTDKNFVRNLKNTESARKEYEVTIEFEREITNKELIFLKEQFTNTVVKQRTPLRVLHRRADLIREKYIYDVNVKKMSSKKAIMKILCQGGLYVKELVTGDKERTMPNISKILENKATPIKLDVLNILSDNEGTVG
jgi:tRNA pseudouridine synthase 10